MTIFKTIRNYSIVILSIGMLVFGIGIGFAITTTFLNAASPHEEPVATDTSNSPETKISPTIVYSIEPYPQQFSMPFDVKYEMKVLEPNNPLKIDNVPFACSNMYQNNPFGPPDKDFYIYKSPNATGKENEMPLFSDEEKERLFTELTTDMSDDDVYESLIFCKTEKGHIIIVTTQRAGDSLFGLKVNSSTPMTIIKMENTYTNETNRFERQSLCTYPREFFITDTQKNVLKTKCVGSVGRPIPSEFIQNVYMINFNDKTTTLLQQCKQIFADGMRLIEQEIICTK